MPPRNATGRGGPQRGGQTPRGGHSSAARRGGQPLGVGAAASGRGRQLTALYQFCPRKDFGRDGLRSECYVNSFAVEFEANDIYHYDVVVNPSNMAIRVKAELFAELQNAQPAIFSPKVSYDGQKNVYSPRKLPFPGDAKSSEFAVTVAGNPNSQRPPRVVTFILTEAAKINTEVIQRFIEGKDPHDERVLTAIMALNVAVRMRPNTNPRFSYNRRSFFTPDGLKSIGGGIELWRGLFQSIRPTIDRLVLNVDLTASAMFKSGPLIPMALEILGKAVNSDPNLLAPSSGLPLQRRIQLQKALAGIRVRVNTGNNGDRQRVIRALSESGANQTFFTPQAGGPQISVAQYFHSLGRPLQYPKVLCVQLGQSAMIPFELCIIPPGQIMRKKLGDDKIKDMLEFTTLKPDDRMKRIRTEVHSHYLQNLVSNQPDYVADFGMTVSTEPLKVPMRVIDPPKMKYQGAASATEKPSFGAWNMAGKKFIEAKVIHNWALVNYDGRAFRDEDLRQMAKTLVDEGNAVGIKMNPQGVIKTEHPHGSIPQHLRDAGMECRRLFKALPTIIFVVLPEGSADMYRAVKFFGDADVGVPTQCFSSKKCHSRSKKQYWANVMLKVNAKLGGINTVPDSDAITKILDNASSTIIIGADVNHPAPGVDDAPSFTAVVGNVDLKASRYVADLNLQFGREEIIADLKDMCKKVISQHIDYRVHMEKMTPALAKPKRMIFFRDGVSEGQFKDVLKEELPQIREACNDLGLPNIKITLAVVRKRHHNQLFPTETGRKDKSGNCPAGSVIDSDIVHPTDFEFILQSHAGLLGTSRPGLYTVLLNECDFNSDTMQSISFALCHVYAPATRSVSIPAPIYYADKACGRARNHLPVDAADNLSQTVSNTSTGKAEYIANLKAKFKGIHSNVSRLMYFC